MGVGAACLILISCGRGSFAPVAAFGISQWLAAIYLGAFGSALTFYLWAFALERTTPTRVAISVTLNPITASLVGAALLHEPLRWNLVGGIVTVFTGIWIATTAGRRPAAATQLPPATLDETNTSLAHPKYRTPRRWRTRNLPTPATPPSPPVLPPARSGPSESSTA
jgi:EamA-like transporter family